MIFFFKRLLQDFELLQALSLHAADEKFEALALGQLLCGQCDPPTKVCPTLS